MKTTNLVGPALNWAVAKAEGMFNGNPPVKFTDHNDDFYEPSLNWAQGGLIIDREDIDLWRNGNSVEAQYSASIGAVICGIRGPTKLIAAMRCFVASKLGNEIAIPEGLS